MLDLETLGYFLFMEEQEQREVEKKQDPPSVQPMTANNLIHETIGTCGGALQSMIRSAAH